jgi:hypothetical protein
MRHQTRQLETEAGEPCINQMQLARVVCVTKSFFLQSVPSGTLADYQPLPPRRAF